MAKKARAGREWELEPDVEPAPLDDTRTFLPELIFGACLIFEIVFIGGISLSLIAMGVLCIFGVLRAPSVRSNKFAWYPVVCLLALIYIGVVSHTGVMPLETWSKRELRIGVTLLFVWLLATGRLHVKSVFKGFLFGMAFNFVAFYAGVAPRPYLDLLSGWFGDKNRAGLAHALIGLSALSLVRGRLQVLAVCALTAGALWLTGSRTSMAAFGLGLIWFFITSRAGLVLRVLTGTGLIWVFGYAEEQFARFGTFASRTGSDLLRARIDAAAWAKVEAAPWQGVGLGSGRVVVANNEWFFHNAYWVMLVEGGWIFLIFAVAITALLGFRLIAPRPIPRLQAAAESATFATLFCATRLGDVFFTTAWALVLGIAALSYGRGDRPEARRELLEPGRGSLSNSGRLW